MEDRARSQFLSIVVLVVVFAAGGLVGAAVTDRDVESAEESTAHPAEESEGEAPGNTEGERRRQYMFERAGATEEQASWIRSEILTWYRAAIKELENDSTIRALDSRADSARDEWRARWRELEMHYRPRREALEDSARTLIREVLDPEVQLRYDSILAEWDRRERDSDERRWP
ncbi:MAG: hypothetical protein RQ745_01965 [Longimicrobiales bacterium]|nr:hypothetical protein [Longimicrobiales bacterium]